MVREAFPSKETMQKSYKNIYEMSGAVKLSFANKATRSTSTSMGSLWERIAALSLYAINPESEFGVRLPGIDLISKNIQTNIIEYKQLKSQKDTLTGSQKKRSVLELEINDNPVFCAVLHNKSSWNFKHKDIQRVSSAAATLRVKVNQKEPFT